MHAFTSGLPVVVRGDSDRLLGITTEMAMQNGVVIGIVMEIEGVIRLLKSRYRGLNIILTGGDSAFFAEKLKTKIFVDPFLVLYGLYQIHQFNVGKTV
jgi:type III pantothenate kinase